MCSVPLSVIFRGCLDKIAAMPESWQTCSCYRLYLQQAEISSLTSQKHVENLFPKTAPAFREKRVYELDMKNHLFFFTCPFIMEHSSPVSASVNVSEIQVAGFAEVLCEMT